MKKKKVKEKAVPIQECEKTKIPSPLCPFERHENKIKNALLPICTALGAKYVCSFPEALVDFPTKERVLRGKFEVKIKG